MTSYRIITEKQLEAMEIEEIADLSTFHDRLIVDLSKYNDWLKFISGRYAIWNALTCRPTEKEGYYEIDFEEINQALNDDGTDKPACLSEDTQLMRLIWANYRELS